MTQINLREALRENDDALTVAATGATENRRRADGVRVFYPGPN